MAYPVAIIEIAFVTTPFVTPTWVDVSAYVMSGQVTRGRTSELDKIRAGQATLVLTNEDRRFDPTHATGAHYPNVLPMRRLRIRETYNAVTYPVFDGYIDRWEQQYEHPGNATAVVSATDAFKVLAAKDLPSSAWAAEVNADGPRAWWRLGEPDDAAVAFDATDNAYHGAYTGTTGGASLIARDENVARSFDGVADRVDLPPAAALAGTSWTIEMWVRQTVTEPSNLFLQGSDTASQIQIGTGTFGGIAWRVNNTSGGPSGGDLTLGPNHVVLTRSAGNITLFVNNTKVGPSALGLTQAAATDTLTLVPPADAVFTALYEGLIDEVVLYDTVLSDARVAAHYNAGQGGESGAWGDETSGVRVGRILDTVGWPTADRDIDAGNSTLGTAALTGSALSYLQKVEESEGGLLFITNDGKVRFRSRHNGFNLPSAATFGDGGGAELEYVDIAFDYSESLIYNEIRVSRSEGVIQTAEDVTSQTAYGERTLTTDGLLIADDAESRDRANFLLGKYKDPVFRTTRMVVQPSGGNETGLYPQVLGRELGDKVTVRRKPQNVGATIDQAVIIEGIKHEFADLFWRTEFMLSPSAASSAGGNDTEYLQLNDTNGPGLGFVALAY